MSENSNDKPTKYITKPLIIPNQPGWLRRRWIVLPIGFSVGFILALTGGRIPYLYIIWNAIPPEKQFEAIVAAFRAGISLLGTLGTILAAVLLWFRFKNDRDRFELAQKQFEETRNREQKQFEYNRQKDREQRFSEQFSTAIEQLGSNNVHMRLGGIYTLEQVGQPTQSDIVEQDNDRQEERRKMVMNVLTAFLRSPPSLEVESSDNGEISKKARVDIQAAFDVVCRLKGQALLNLESCQLVGVELKNRIALRRANLAGANLAGAKLVGAYLEKAILSEAKLRQFKFEMQ